MAARVTLTMTEGSLQGRKLVFTGPSRCIVGRANDCNLCLPSDIQNQVVSRRHCTFEIDPPSVRVWDLGSLNGTYLNGQRIGMRPEGMTPEQARGLERVAFELLDGDEVQVGSTVFLVNTFVPVECSACSRPIPEEETEAAEATDGGFLCDTCRQQEPEPCVAYGRPAEEMAAG
jgi:serine/threonine-protein kinase